MPVTHGVRGSSPLRTARKIENQSFILSTPNFTSKNVKLGVGFVFFISEYIHKAKIADLYVVCVRQIGCLLSASFNISFHNEHLAIGPGKP